MMSQSELHELSESLHNEIAKNLIEFSAEVDKVSSASLKKVLKGVFTLGMGDLDLRKFSAREITLLETAGKIMNLQYTLANVIQIKQSTSNSSFSAEKELKLTTSSVNNQDEKQTGESHGSEKMD